ncbi:putative NPL4 family [Trypanosoma vivax]|uniref:Nuclear pore localisation protein NPL4 C-terminal domain-containing protein n=1 Tax=Trypanosoma vivax (strain Y486) TaxID=1055687 RepID=G0TSE7_TRYVY|nr:hypothetical protein TRVL_03917 [Trypanosoma vivax]KAH8605518.1 putative NPL4 family [Trypanosoma vivax]CCC46874.1 conserved hypothetical protein [Trypanosoma vivax Y486]
MSDGNAQKYEAELQRALAERRRRFEGLRSKEPPQASVCNDCGKPLTFATDVCRVSGMLHNRGKGTIIGGLVTSSRFIDSSSLLKAIDKTRVRWEKNRTNLVLVDQTSINIFQTFCRTCGWCVQRYALLYGRYDNATKTVEVHAIYEPKQHGDARTFHFEKDENIRTVDMVAEGLELRRVGAICTHPKRDSNAVVLTAREMLLCAREQSIFGDECVLLTVYHDDVEDRTHCSAWQVSTQAIELYRNGFLSESNGARGPDDEPATTDEQTMWEREARLCSEIELEVAETVKDDKGGCRSVIKKMHHEIDVTWFVSYIGIKEFDSNVVRNLFVRLSRPGMDPPTYENLKIYLDDPKRRDMRRLEKYADFHVLVFLACTALSEEQIRRVTGAIIHKKSEANADEVLKTVDLLLAEFSGTY